MLRRFAALLGIVAVLAVVGAVAWLLADDAASGVTTVGAPAPRDAASMTPPEGADAGVSAAPGLPGAPGAEVEVLAAAPGGLLLAGTVVGPDGAPVEGATVQWRSSASADRDLPPEAEVVTPADGSWRFAFEAPPTEGRKLVADAPGHVSIGYGGGTNWESNTDLTIALPWAVPVSGVVRDAETGAPVAGATVHGGEESFVTGGDGVYRLTEVAVGWQVALRATHPDYAEGSVEFLLSGNTPGRKDIELVRGVAVELVVVDRETGEPLPGAAFRRWSRGGPEAVADGAGAVTMRVAPGEPRWTTVTADDHVPLRWGWDGAEARPGLSIRLPLSGLAWADVRVTDEDGAPVEDVELDVWEVSSTPGRDVVPEETLEAFGTPGTLRDDGDHTVEQTVHLGGGRFSVPVRPTDAPLGVHAWHPEYVSETVEPVELRHVGDRVGVELLLRRGGTVRGHVTRNGEPVSGAHVRLRDADGRGAGLAYLSGGDYEVERVPAGELTLTVRRVGDQEVLHEATVTVSAGEVTVHDVAIEQAVATISGRAVFAGGEPAEDVVVRARATGGPLRSVASAKTDAEGRFELEVAPDGVYDVTGGDTLPVTLEAVPAGAEDLVLELVPDTTLHLQLVDARTGDPVRLESAHEYDRWLHWRMPGDETWHLGFVPIDIDGRVEFEVPVGRVDLAVHLEDEGFRAARVNGLLATSPADERPVRVALERGGEVRLRFVDAASGEGSRPGGHEVFVVPEATRHLVRSPAEGEASSRLNGVGVVTAHPGIWAAWTQPDEDGSATLRGLSPGRYAIVVLPEGLPVVPDGFTVPAPDDGPIVVRWGSPPGG